MSTDALYHTVSKLLRKQDARMLDLEKRCIGLETLTADLRRRLEASEARVRELQTERDALSAMVKGSVSSVEAREAKDYERLERALMARVDEVNGRLNTSLKDARRCILESSVKRCSAAVAHLADKAVAAVNDEMDARLDLLATMLSRDPSLRRHGSQVYSVLREPLPEGYVSQARYEKTLHRIPAPWKSSAYAGAGGGGGGTGAGPALDDNYDDDDDGGGGGGGGDDDEDGDDGGGGGGVGVDVGIGVGVDGFGDVGPQSPLSQGSLSLSAAKAARAIAVDPRTPLPHTELQAGAAKPKQRRPSTKEAGATAPSAVEESPVPDLVVDAAADMLRMALRHELDQRRHSAAEVAPTRGAAEDVRSRQRPQRAKSAGPGGRRKPLSDPKRRPAPRRVPRAPSGAYVKRFSHLVDPDGTRMEVSPSGDHLRFDDPESVKRNEGLPSFARSTTTSSRRRGMNTRPKSAGLVSERALLRAAGGESAKVPATMSLLSSLGKGNITYVPQGRRRHKPTISRVRMLDDGDATSGVSN